RSTGGGQRTDLDTVADELGLEGRRVRGTVGLGHVEVPHAHRAVRLAGHVDRELAAGADSDGAGDLTRRTLAEADLGGDDDDVVTGRDRTTGAGGRGHRGGAHAARIAVARRDRKSTRLNSSHVKISYAV